MDASRNPRLRLTGTGRVLCAGRAGVGGDQRQLSPHGGGDVPGQRRGQVYRLLLHRLHAGPGCYAGAIPPRTQKDTPENMNPTDAQQDNPKNSDDYHMRQGCGGGEPDGGGFEKLSSARGGGGIYSSAGGGIAAAWL